MDSCFYIDTGCVYDPGFYIDTGCVNDPGFYINEDDKENTSSKDDDPMECFDTVQKVVEKNN